jgi:hypothetical protein
MVRNYLSVQYLNSDGQDSDKLGEGVSISFLLFLSSSTVPFVY